MHNCSQIQRISDYQWRISDPRAAVPDYLRAQLSADILRPSYPVDNRRLSTLHTITVQSKTLDMHLIVLTRCTLRAI